MRDYGLVSIITPNWNCERFVSETIRSVQAQTYQNWEMIIVDDFSTDNSERIIQSFCEVDNRIRLLKNSGNCGAAVSRNYALREAKGKWIAFLDSDDLWLPGKLERQLDFMVAGGHHFSYTEYIEMDESGKDTGIRITGPKVISRHGMYDFCWPGCLTVMYDREFVGLIQISDIRKNNDYAMWLKICYKADCHLLPEILAKYRSGRPGTISSHSYLTLIKWHYILFHDAVKENAFSSALLTLRNIIFGVYKKIRYVKRY